MTRSGTSWGTNGSRHVLTVVLAVSVILMAVACRLSDLWDLFGWVLTAH
ncbi:hypothetical protein AB0M43_34745 [Longispora sp. NPDC051575]